MTMQWQSPVLLRSSSRQNLCQLTEGRIKIVSCLNVTLSPRGVTFARLDMTKTGPGQQESCNLNFEVMY
jgi:hypothetical protein